MITCRKSTEWVIKKEYKKLSVKQNLQLLSHMTICKCCRLFERQSAFIDKAFQKNKSNEVSYLTTQEKEVLFRSIQNNING